MGHYNTRQYTVTIIGKGSVRIVAASFWHAIDRAYSMNHDIEPDRNKYVIGKCKKGMKDTRKAV